MNNEKNWRMPVKPIVFLCIAISLVGCKTENSNLDKTILANMHNYNWVSQTNENLYVIPSDNHLYRGKMSANHEVYLEANLEPKVDEDMELVAEDVENFFIIDCEKIFYNEISSDMTKYLDETNQQSKKIFDFSCFEMTSYGNRLYFTDENGILKSSNYDGSDIEMISEGFAEFLFPYGEYLYYCIRDDNDMSMICQYDYNSKIVDVLVGDYIDNIVVLNDKIYYTDMRNLYSFDLNTKEIQAITKDGVVIGSSLNIYGDYVIYSNLNEIVSTVALNTKNGHSFPVSYMSCSLIYVIGDHLVTDRGVIEFNG